MKLRCLERKFTYKDKLGRMKESTPGEVIELPEITPEDRQLIVDLVVVARAIPDGCPETLKIETVLAYSARVDSGVIDGGERGTVRELPASIAWPLVARGYVRPQDRRYWWPGRDVKPENEKVVRLYADDSDKKKATAGRLTGHGGGS
jgi:hypothetical protein